jgi:hypothetical protein
MSTQTSIKYKYNEAKLLNEVKRHIDKGYLQDKKVDQEIDVVLKNIEQKSKYSRNDLLKLVHFSLIALDEHDKAAGKRSKSKRTQGKVI